MNIQENEEIKSKFDELLNYKFNKSIHPYYGELVNFDIRKEETIKKAIRLTIIDCFSDFTVYQKHKPIIEKKLSSYLNEDFYVAFSDEDKNDLKLMAILVIHYVIRQLCDFLSMTPCTVDK